MSEAVLVFPLLSGKREALNIFIKALTTDRREEYDLLQHGVSSFSWYLQPTPQGDFIVIHLRASDPPAVFNSIASSKGAFDIWFREQVKDLTGVDLTIPPPNLPQRIFHWERTRPSL